MNSRAARDGVTKVAFAAIKIFSAAKLIAVSALKVERVEWVGLLEL
jgi:hypothetical protein